MYVDDPKRWVMLGVLSWASCAECMGWICFSACDPRDVKEYFGSAVPNDAMIDLLLNLGAIVGVVVGPVQMRIGRLRRLVVGGAFLVMAGAVLRCAAGACRHGPPKLVGAMLIVAQSLNAAAGPALMATSSKLACAWFPERERFLATSVALTANNLGVVLLYPVAPALARRGVGVYLGLLALVAAPPCFASPWFRDAPLFPPSAAAVAQRRRLSSSWGSYAAALASSGLVTGAASAWQGALQVTLREPAGTVGWIGFANAAAGVAGSIGVACVLRQTAKDAARFKPPLVWLLLGTAACATAWSVVTLPRTGLYALSAALGLAQGGTDPIFYELGAELVPATETTTAGLLVLVDNITEIVLLALPPTLLARAISPAFAAIAACSAILVHALVVEAHCRPADTDRDALLSPPGLLLRVDDDDHDYDKDRRDAPPSYRIDDDGGSRISPSSSQPSRV